MIALLATIALAGAYDSPSREAQQTEREECGKSALCRAVIDDRPAILFRARNDEPQCQHHALKAARALHALGVPFESMRFAYGEVAFPTKRGEKHAVLFVTLDGTEWAVDNGGLGYFSNGSPVCPNKVCRASEALQALQYVLYRDIIDAEHIATMAKDGQP